MQKEVVIIDGQGGKVGRLVAERMKAALPEQELTVLGTNSIATANMLKSGAERGATGENPVVLAAGCADIIICVLGIAIPHSLLGEVTPAMAEAVGKSRAAKLFIPSNRCHFQVMGVAPCTLTELVEQAVAEACRILKSEP